MRDLYALDIETSGLDRFKDRILAIGVYNPEFSFCFQSVSAFADWLAGHPSARFVMHNGSFDYGFLRYNGCNIFDQWAADSRTIASTLLPRPLELGLEYLANEILGIPSYKLDRKNMESYSWEEIRDYCLKDCKITYDLYQYLLKNTDQDFVNKWIMPATKLVAQMEYGGVYVDKAGIEIYQAEMTAKRDAILAELKERSQSALNAWRELQIIEIRNRYREMYEKAKEKTKDKTKCLERYKNLEHAAISRLEDFNWNSPKQLIWLLKDYYGLDIADREGDDSTSEAVLSSIDHPVAKKLCEYREVEKLVSTCIPALVENIKADGFVHTHYHIGGTRTGRLSSSGPNLQQIPRGRIRSFIQASSSNSSLVTIDYGQIEVRIIAEVAKEKELINAFKEGIDPYSIIAQKLLQIDCPVREIKSRFKKERDVSKTAGLSILYGTGAAKLQEVLKKELGLHYLLSECKAFIRDYRDSFPGVKKFKENIEKSLANKKIYHNLLGRPFIIESNDDLYMKSLNTLVQGSASDLVVHAALKVQQKLQKLDVDHQFRLLVHDEIVIELPEDEANLLVTEVIEPAMTTEVETELGLTVPLKIEYSISREWEKP